MGEPRRPADSEVAGAAPTGAEAGDTAHRGRLVGLCVGPLLFVAILAAPLPDLAPRAHVLAGIFAWAVVYWMTAALPLAVTALLASVLAIAFGVAPARAVLAPYADPVIFLFIGSFIIAAAMRRSGLDTRFAFALLRREWATRTPRRLLATLGTITCALSLWVSNTATTAIMLPVGRGLLRGFGPAGDSAQSRFPIGLMLMLTWSSSVAVGIPVGSPPNLIAIGMVRELGGRRLSFFDWVAVAMPLTLLMLALCWVILAWRYGEPAARAGDVRAWIAGERARLGPWRRAEVNVLVVFALVCVLWMLPGAVAAIASPAAALPRFFEAHLPESVIALAGAVLLFLLPTDVRRGEFTISWREAQRIDWGTILLFGGGLSLGHLMFDTGLAAAVGRALVRASGAEGVWALTAIAIVAGILLSEASSNTASASVVVPVMIAVAAGLGVSPVPPALGAALGASFGFMLPVSTPPNAIVYGSGLVPLREMIRSGILLDVLGGAVIWLGLRVLCPLTGVV
ncbi:MAG: DASS family sodium-coupled anion symporter [Candidatus Rokubacteria bacterium]|nr:DASS family sodium-coupled anion symporter [Candidatus Rokubacteria bacterium]